MRSPRKARMAAAGNCTRSAPSNLIEPPAMRPWPFGNKPMIDSDVTLLPQPDSPTIPSVRPDSTEKLMPSTAVNSPPSTLKQVVKSRTSSNALIGQAPRYPLRYWPWKRPSGSCGRLEGLAAGSVKTRNFRFDHAAIDDASRVLAAGQARNERLKAFQTDLVQTAQFNQGFCVIVDPQIERRVVLPAVDDQRGALLAAFVATGRFAGRQSGDQPFGKRLISLCSIAVGAGLNDLRTGQHVPGDREPLSQCMATPADAVGSSVRSAAAHDIDHVKLPLSAASVGRQKCQQQLGRIALLRHALQGRRDQQRVHQCLRGECTDTAARMRTQSADSEKLARHGDTEGTRSIASDDRPRHEYSLRSDEQSA